MLSRISKRAFQGVTLALSTFLVACSASESIESTLQTSALEGTVYEVDGEANNLGGIGVTLSETGHFAVTGSDGSFSFEDLDAGSYTLRFDTHGEIADESDDGESEGDAREEGEDSEGHPRVDVNGDGDRVEVRVAIEDGEVKDFSVGHHEYRHAIARMFPAEHAPYRAEGRIKIAEIEDGFRFVVTAAPFEPGTVVEIWVDDRKHDPVLVGTAVAEGGEIFFERDTRASDLLPFGVLDIDALENYRVEVRLADTEELMLIGEIPALPREMEHPREEDGKDDDEEESDDDERDEDESDDDDERDEDESDDDEDESDGEDDESDDGDDESDDDEEDGEDEGDDEEESDDNDESDDDGDEEEEESDEESDEDDSDDDDETEEDKNEDENNDRE